MTWCSEKAGMAGAGARRWVGTQGDDVTGRPGDPEFEESTWVRVWVLRIQRLGNRVGPDVNIWGFKIYCSGFRVEGFEWGRGGNWPLWRPRVG